MDIIVVMVAPSDELQQLKRFHGHLGPYVVIGYRMGMIARERLRGKLRATVMTGSRPPISCIIDGVQFSSSCTMGKGNLNIEEKGEAVARFVDDSHILEIRLKDEIRARVDRTMTKETEESIALSLYGEPANDLFHVTEVESTLTERALKLR
jgi:formylmethanofuran dehydrogenase subunit E